MKKVEQLETDRETGDCMRASIASILELDIQAVPHLLRTHVTKWFSVMYYFFISYGYIYQGHWYPNQGLRKLLKKDSINGFYLAVVKSRTYPDENVTHLVVVDKELTVVHDPNPNKLWDGVNLKRNKDLKSIYLFRKMNDTDKNYWHYVH